MTDNFARRMSSDDRQSKRILVVDDNDMLLKAWDRILGARHLNYQHYRLSNHPEEALEWLRTNQFDIAIIDVVMPTLDGFDFVRQAWKYNPDMQLVFTTAYNCDFRSVSLPILNDENRDIHVLLKPYQNIDKIEEFVDRLCTNDRALQEAPPLFNQNNLRFHLWRL